jgi:hypothetical protein
MRDDGHFVRQNLGNKKKVQFAGWEEHERFQDQRSLFVCTESNNTLVYDDQLTLVWEGKGIWTLEDKDYNNLSQYSKN